MTRTARDITGQVFRRLTAVERAANRGKEIRWLFQCDCGKQIVALTSNVKSGRTKSCGCLSAESTSRRSKTHGMSRTKIYYVWKSMRQRCLNTRNRAYDRYGGRGINICKRWNDFANFLEDMGQSPSSDHSIERIDNDGDYCPDNCKWATYAEQGSNKRNNRYLTVYGKKKNATEWSYISGTTVSSICKRLVLGWSDKEAVFGRSANYNLKKRS